MVLMSSNLCMLTLVLIPRLAVNSTAGGIFHGGPVAVLLMRNKPRMKAILLISNGFAVNPIAMINPFILSTSGAPSYAALLPENTAAAWTPPFVEVLRSDA